MTTYFNLARPIRLARPTVERRSRATNRSFSRTPAKRVGRRSSVRTVRLTLLRRGSDYGRRRGRQDDLFRGRAATETLVGETQQATVNALAQLIGYELERDQYEAALERSKRRFQSLFERAPDGILIHDTDGQITDVNRAVVEALGYTEDELLSMNVSDIEVGIDRDDLLEAWGRRLGGTHSPSRVLTVERMAPPIPRKCG
ncbi:PAS domain S-box protein [Natrialba swarupiae]|nr:PAS domain S-box protein [Natrialba swarupiae]